MSEEFSGHTTRSGRGASPASIRAASRWVTRTWLSSTARRSAKASSPSPGTLPCTAATRTRGSPGRPGCQGNSDARQARTTAAATPATARPGVFRATSTAQARVVPTQGHRERRAGGADVGQRGATGVSSAANASRPHGKPPNGTSARSASTSTHAQATHSGHPGTRRRAR